MMPLASVLGFGTSLYLIKEQLYCLTQICTCEHTPSSIGTKAL